MTEYSNTNKGTLGKARERKTDKHPEYTGKINVEGRDYWLSGWVREGKDGKFFSLSVKPKDEQKAEQKPASSFDDLDASIPF